MRKTKSAIFEAVHDTAIGLHNAGVMDGSVAQSERPSARRLTR